MDRDEDYLLLFLREPPTALVAQALEGEATRLETARPWSVEAPQIVDVPVPGARACGCASGCPGGGASTLGLTLLVPTAQASKATPGGDARALGDCEEVLAAATRLSGALGVTFAAELNGEPLGAIAGGELGPELSQGLLAPWRQAVQRSKG